MISRHLLIACLFALAACQARETTTAPDPAVHVAGNFGGPPVESRAADPGQRVFENKCAACHGNTPLAPGTMKLAQRTEGNDRVLTLRKGGVPADYVKQVVRNGMVAMPPFPVTEISDAELDRLAAYLAKVK